MASRADELASSGVGVFVIGFDDIETLRDMKRRLESPFTFLGDETRAAYRALALGRAGLLRTYLHPQVVGPYLGFALNRRFPRLQAKQDRRQLGGDFVLDREGHMVFSHPERGPEDRAPVGKIVRSALSAV